jgi:hypothetical protein
MNRKSLLLGIAIFCTLICAGALLAGLVTHEPEFYRETALPPGKARTHQSGEFVGAFGNLYQSIAADREWSAQFPEKWINSFFDEQFVSMGWADKVLPEGFRAPRIAIQPDKIRLAFRYRLGPVSTVISIDMRVWLPSKETNVVALELQGLHAGSVPIAAQSLLERVSETARQNNIEVTWYRHKGYPVALLRFQADQDHPTYRLERLKLHQGEIEIRGRSIDASPLRAMGLPDPTKTAAE